MARVEIQRIAEAGDRSLPIFAKCDKIADRIRVAAYKLFSHRGERDGNALDDWLEAEREFCWPAAALSEHDDDYSLKIALAGFEPKEITITATPREIVVQATHEETVGGDDGGDENLRWSEFRSNDVLRRVELPGEANVDAITASLKNGLLEIIAPKASEDREVELSVPS
jgi:HSP20 family protein